MIAAILFRVCARARTPAQRRAAAPSRFNVPRRSCSFTAIARQNINPTFYRSARDSISCTLTQTLTAPSAGAGHCRGNTGDEDARASREPLENGDPQNLYNARIGPSEHRFARIRSVTVLPMHAASIVFLLHAPFSLLFLSELPRTCLD